MWESPITQMINDISTQIVEEQENQIMTKVNQTIGYDIDKHELFRALNYDREQYNKGYADAKQEFERKLQKLLYRYGILDKKFQDTTVFEDELIRLAYPARNGWNEVDQ